MTHPPSSGEFPLSPKESSINPWVAAGRTSGDVESLDEADDARRVRSNLAEPGEVLGVKDLRRVGTLGRERLERGLAVLLDDVAPIEVGGVGLLDVVGWAADLEQVACGRRRMESIDREATGSRTAK